LSGGSLSISVSGLYMFSFCLATLYNKSSQIFGFPFPSRGRIHLRPFLVAHSWLSTTEHGRMTEKHKASSLDTPTCHLADTSPILLTAPRHSQIEIAVPDDDLVPRNPGVTCQRRLNLPSSDFLLLQRRKAFWILFQVFRSLTEAKWGLSGDTIVDAFSKARSLPSALVSAF
jgi:hypothetical protein